MRLRYENFFSARRNARSANRGKRFALLTAAAVLSASLLAGCAGGGSSANNAGSGNAGSVTNSANSGSVTDGAAAGGSDSAAETPLNVGTLSLQDINGAEYTEAMFADHDLTLLNIFATWCSPCVQEIPYLEQLPSEMADANIGVVGVVMDVLNEDGTVNEQAQEIAKQLAEKTGATYPFLIPDAGMMNGLLSDITAFPTTYFIDKDGNVVSSAYLGGRSLEDWKVIAGNELLLLKEGR